MAIFYLISTTCCFTPDFEHVLKYRSLKWSGWHNSINQRYFCLQLHSRLRQYARKGIHPKGRQSKRKAETKKKKETGLSSHNGDGNRSHCRELLTQNPFLVVYFENSVLLLKIPYLDLLVSKAAAVFFLYLLLFPAHCNVAFLIW